MKIDVFTHVMPKRYKQALYKYADRFATKKAVQDKRPTLTDNEARLSKFDGYEDLVQILSTAMPPVEEVGAWREAMQLQPQPSKILFADAITYFAGALGAARNGDTAAAEKDAEELARLHKALQDAKNNYWATEVEIQRLAVAGWIALGALILLRSLP